MSWRDEMQRPAYDGRSVGRKPSFNADHQAPSPSTKTAEWQNKIKQLIFEYRSLRKSIDIARSARQLTNSARQAPKPNDTLQLSSDVQKNVDDLSEHLEKFLALFVSPKDSFSTEQPTEESNFASENSDVVFEIIVFLCELVCQMTKHEEVDSFTKNLLLRFTGVIVSLTEKSPFQVSKSYHVFNKLVSQLLDIGALTMANLKSRDMSSNSRVLLEIFRAIGSLIYANGSCLNEDNLRFLFGADATKDPPNSAGFLASLRAAIELEIANERSHDIHSKELNKLDLITTQLIFNLTLPHVTLVNSHPITTTAAYSRNNRNQSFNPNSQPTVVQTRYDHIADKYKLRCVYLLVRILRFHGSFIKSSISKTSGTSAELTYTQMTGSHFTSNKSRLNDDDFVNTAKIVTKSLQGIENLIASIELLKQQSDEAAQISQQNWIFMSGSEYQLGDILAIAKSFSFFSLQNLLGSDQAKSPMSSSLHEEKLKPSAISIPTIAGNDNEAKALRKKKSNDDDDDPWNTDDENKTKAPGKNEPKTKNKRMTKTNDPKTSNSSDSSAASAFLTNSVRCLKDQQVALMQTKPFNNLPQSEAGLDQKLFPSMTSDSEISNSESTGFVRSSSSFYIESCCAKVRVSAIGVLQTIFECLDKKTVLSYWDSFLDTSNTFNLMWLVKNDQSPKVRLMATNTLAVYLECARSFFTIAATDSSSAQPQQASASFLPISFKIASLIRQYHNDLLVSLCRLEKTPTNIIQLLKCLQSLIKATPYHKLKSGLVYKLLTNLCLLLNSKTIGLSSSKAANIGSQVGVIVAVINCIQFILTIHHQLAEVHLALISPLNVTKKLVANNKIDEDGNGETVESELSDKLEQISFSFKKPILTPSRVTYFYTNENSASLNTSFSSSLNCSATNSGHMTPLYSVACSELGALADESSEASFNKCWFIDYCLRQSATTQTDAGRFGSSNQPIRLACLDALLVISSKYFDLLNRDVFFKQICELILGNIEFMSSQLADFDAGYARANSQANANAVGNELFQTLKLLEEFARCLATNELRALTNIDLNDCCQFWSAVLGSKLVTQLLPDEQRYMISSTACDCLAAIGAPIFELLSTDKRIVCFTSVLSLTKSSSNMIRSASIRALGVFITFPSLKEDLQFLYDVSNCLLYLLKNDLNNLVRQQASWSLSNFSEVLVENGEKLGASFTEDFQLPVWLSLLRITSETCSRESDKLKSYLVRALGNLLNYISKINNIDMSDSKLAGIEGAIDKAVEALCQCKSAKMLKVKWNLSYSIGVAIRQMITWKWTRVAWIKSLYETLIELFSLSNNFKVQINACIALMTINLNDVKSHAIGSGRSVSSRLWSSLMDAFSKLNLSNVNQQFNSSQDQHKKNLLFQLCRLFTYMCKYVRLEDLEDIIKSLNELKLNQAEQGQSARPSSLTITNLRDYLKSYLSQIFDQMEANKAEIQIFNEALTQLNLLKSSVSTSLHEDCIGLLLSVLQKPVAFKQGAGRADGDASSKYESDESESELADEYGKTTKNESFREKYPFKQIYD